jgi:hypothetical protein
MEKIQKYDLLGNFIDEFNIQFAGKSFACADDYMYIYAGNHPNRINDWQLRNYYLLICNKKDGSLIGDIPFNDNPNFGTTKRYNFSNAFYHYKDGTRFYSPYLYDIYSIEKNKVDIAYQFDFGKYNLPKDLNLYSREELDGIPHAYGLNLCWENDWYLSFNMINPNPCDVLYLKKEERVYSGYFYDDVWNCGPPKFVQATNDFVLGYQPAEMCFEISRHSKNENSLIKKITSEIKEDDNPVVFFYYFKKETD